MVIELRVAQSQYEIVLMISNLTRVARLFDFQTTPVILDQVIPQLLNSYRRPRNQNSFSCPLKSISVL